MVRRCSADALVDELLAPGPIDPAGLLVPLVVLDRPPEVAGPERVASAVRRLATEPVVVVADGWEPVAAADGLVDVVVSGPGERSAVEVTVERCPLAATTFVLLLRGGPPRTTGAGLVVESAHYSALQAGPEFAAWRTATPRRDRGDRDAPRVRVERSGDELRVTLTRPAVRNALDAAMRDQLLDALAVAEADRGLRVVLAGEGPSFCAGGDLDEFGSFTDPASAHGLRLHRSIGAALDRLAGRTTVVVHGPCAGSGVELAAFAGTVVARPDVALALPELGMGLVPGAGGTVSVTRRIGRRRTAWLGLTGRAIDAATALDWGLVDRIEADPAS